MPMNNENVNTELFENKEQMRVKTAELQRGMSKAQVFDVLAVPTEKFATMNTEDIQKTIYGNSQVQGTPDQLEKFRKRMMAYEGYSLPYRHVESKGSLGFGKMKVDKTGHDLQLLLVFENARLLKASVVGNEDIQLSEDKYLWNALLKGGMGRVF